MSDWIARVRGQLFRAAPGNARGIRAVALGTGRFGWILGESFVRDHCMQKSAALTYTTILSLFPLLAVFSLYASRVLSENPDEARQRVVGFLKQYILPTEGGLSFPQTEKQLRDLVGADSPSTSTLTASQSPPSLAEPLASQFEAFQDTAGKAAGIGAIGLLVSAIALFASCEKFFNEIWRVPTRRSLARIFSAFCTLLVSLPLLIAATTYVSHQAGKTLGFVENLHAFGPVARGAMRIANSVLPFLLLTLTLAAAIYLVPNTRVRARAALAGGLASAILWTLAKGSFYLYVENSGVTRSLFGAFGATLVFFVWLYFLWAIVLLGVETAYLAQHYGLAVRERLSLPGRAVTDPRALALVAGRIAQAYLVNQGGVDFEGLRQRVALRDADIEALLEDLLEARFIARREDGRFILDRPPENIRLADLFRLGCQGEAISAGGNGNDALLRSLKELDLLYPERYGQKTLKDLVS